MQRKENIDAFGAASLVAFSAVLGLNQVIIKIVNEGLQPVFAAGLRSVGAVVLIFLWMRFRGHWPSFTRTAAPSAILCGTLFASEFILLFLALDLTSVARTSVIFYSMPVWLVLMAHLAIPGERISGRKLLGLALALGGVGWALLDRGGNGEVSLIGDVMALVAAISWAGIALLTRVTQFSRIEPTMQIFWQVTVSAVILLLAAPLFGPLIRDLHAEHLAGMGFQIVVVATAGYLFWFWLLKVYPASGVASFSFLSPVFGVVFGWLILGEEVGFPLLGALVLVAAGLVLINRPARLRPA
ncbi:MAG: DMT family transporter [Rhodobacter sp.]|nr:DMT family transporter [Rhodobacter sp.]